MQLSLINESISIDSIKTWDELIHAKKSRIKRTSNLLRDPLSQDTPDWYMCVPSFFNNALDIKFIERVKTIKQQDQENPNSKVKKIKKTELVWTQGSAFFFEEGCTLYDTINGYLEWSEAIKKIKLCIQIIKSVEATPRIADLDRDPGSITFKILVPNQEKTKLTPLGDYIMTQDEFIRFLIAGPTDKKLWNLIKGGNKIEKFTFYVQGSADEPYQVTFQRNESVINAQCTCPAGKNGQYCKHRMKILHGDTDGIISENLNSVAVIASWLPGSNVEAAINKIVIAENNVALASQILANAKKELAASLMGK